LGPKVADKQVRPEIWLFFSGKMILGFMVVDDIADVN
jgi:hypothetical protein